MVLMETSRKPTLRNLTVVQLIETHGDSDDVVAEWTGERIRVTRDVVQIDGKTVALYEDRHYYPTRDPRNPDPDDLLDECGNEIWIGEFGVSDDS